MMLPADAANIVASGLSPSVGIIGATIDADVMSLEEVENSIKLYDPAIDTAPNRFSNSVDLAITPVQLFEVLAEGHLRRFELGFLVRSRHRRRVAVLRVATRRGESRFAVSGGCSCSGCCIIT